MDRATLLLIGAMGTVTYGMRVVPLLLPLRKELLDRADPYLRLVAPAVLSALTAVSTLVASSHGAVSLKLDADLAPILLGLVTVAVRGNLAIGIGVGVAAAAALRLLTS
jgi:branched-subunit amino acid transport protein